MFSYHRRSQWLVTDGHFGLGRSMDVKPDMARIARTIGEPTRIRMLTLLMEGRALTAKELAYGAGVEPGTATTHLQRLLADALVTLSPQGRHKYFRLTSPDVAACLEALMVVAQPRNEGADEKLSPIHRARFCYDHLAGRIAVRITESLVQEDILQRKENEFVVSRRGARWLTQFGVDLAAVTASRRRHAFACLDWSERKDHVGGALGAALAQRMLTARWIRRKPESREVVITELGQKQLKSHFGITINDA